VSVAKFKLFWFFYVGDVCQQKPKVLKCAAGIALLLTAPAKHRSRFYVVFLLICSMLKLTNNFFMILKTGYGV